MKTILLFALPTTLLLAVAVAAHPQMPSVSPNAMKKISVRLEGCGKEYAYYDALRLTMEHNGAFKLPDDKSFKELNDLDLIQVLSWKTPQGKPGD